MKGRSMSARAGLDGAAANHFAVRGVGAYVAAAVLWEAPIQGSRLQWWGANPANDSRFGLKSARVGAWSEMGVQNHVFKRSD
jgi:hypothetical protein